ncbi:MAG: 2-oxoglutarate dehydrogenase E1 component [Proteobacteria bacterium]|nr:2-oxoglutarate dehydrogenase E1 component [Pseudomonadota bacterium]
MAKNTSVADNFRRWGHLQANIDPINNFPKRPHRDIDEANGPDAEKYRGIYCAKIAAEFMHMHYPERCDWVADKLENSKTKLDTNFILDRLISAEVFEQFIHSKYVGSKWFSLEGLGALIPLLDETLNTAANQGYEVVIIGMAHRGRLSVLHHIANAEASSLFACFEDLDPKSVLGGGDTKYHKGATSPYKTRDGKEIRVHLTSNPSHLEAVNPVVMGRVRAKQQRFNDVDRNKIFGILIHGDAALAGQGPAAESLNFADLNGFSVGGIVHIVANNLIGFTARTHATFSGVYCTDVVKRLPVPIFHVNADSPADVVKLAKMAMEYKKEFTSDVVIDLVGYRRFGHNEMDDPTTTAPALYDKIKTHPVVHQIFAKELGVDKPEIEKIENKYKSFYTEQLAKGRELTKTVPFFGDLPDYWSNYTGGFYDASYEVETAVSADLIKEVTEKITTFPEGFAVHPKIKKAYELRLEMALGKKPIDWGTAEMFAFATLLAQGSPVRVVGQDARRATFNQRMAVLYDMNTEKVHIPLEAIKKGAAFFEIYDSQLSEAAAVGYEYGFSRDYPEALVCWEAQFGDFVNGAQVFIDQFISAGEDKWGLLSSLTMLLPHAYEGMGPEHSSARVERFLQQCAEDNMQVCNLSTAAQYFHLLRRQTLQKWRKPLVIFTPKSMLRLPAAASKLSDFTDSGFQKVMNDTEIFSDASRILVCTGKIVHELRAERAKNNMTDTAIVTVEQLYPFPEKELAALINSYRNLDSIIWVQEEPANMGAYTYMKPLLDVIANGRRVSSVKRSASASPSTGSAKAHAIEQQALLKLAFANYR